MSIIRALCLVLVGAIVVGAQERISAQQKSDEKPSDLCSVEGAVVKSTTGEGIKRATAQLTALGAGQQPYSSLTENNGRFIIRDISPGRYAIIASGSRYLRLAAYEDVNDASGCATTRHSDSLVPKRSGIGVPR